MTRKYLLPIVFIFFFFQIRTGLTLETSIQISSGFDSNASRRENSESSFFAHYDLSLEHSFFHSQNPVDLNGYFQGFYQDYFQLKDNYGVKVGGSIGVPLKNGLVLPRIIGEGFIFRDDLVKEDEKNEWMIGGDLRWHMSGRLTLDIHQTWTWIDYRLPFIMVHQMSPQRHGRKEMVSLIERPRGVQEIEQNDVLCSSSIDTIFYLTPALNTKISAGYGTLDSSVKTESYTITSFGFSANWSINDNWGVEGGFSWMFKSFDHIASMYDREDTIWTGWTRMSYQFSFVEMFIRGDWIYNASTLDQETYHRVITQCGIEFSF